MKSLLSTLGLSASLLAFGGSPAAGADPGTATALHDYASWVSGNAIPEATSAPADRNGPLRLTNLEAFAYGLDPQAALASDLPRLVAADAVTGLRLFYRRNTVATDLVMGFEGSFDLAAWAPFSPAYETRSSSASRPISRLPRRSNGSPGGACRPLPPSAPSRWRTFRSAHTR
jgi:hypothetical protein